MTSERTCTQCGATFPATAEYFYRNGDGLRADCKACVTDEQWLHRLEYQRRYREENREKIAEQQRQYREENREKIAEYIRRYQEENREKLAECQRRHREENPEKGRIRKSRRRARKRELPATFTGEQWLHCLEYHNYCCPVCGQQLRDLFGNIEPHADHWIPLSSDDCPGTVASNMICLCNKCNLSKNATLPDEWLKQTFGKRKAKQILGHIAEYFATVARRELRMNHK